MSAVSGHAREAATPTLSGVRVALVHDWLTGMRGGEKVLEAICELFPEAPLYTLVHVPGTVSPIIEKRTIVTSFAQSLPNPRRHYRHYLPIYPLAVELFNLQDYDLVVSSSHCAVKSVKARPGATHVCYCHSPMRYAWDQFDSYFGPAQVGRLGSALLRPVMGAMARWDAATAGRVDRFLANSQYVAGRIRRYYNRGSTIVYPPVDTDYYSPDSRPTSPSFLIVSALVPYKRLEVAIQACARIGAPLRIVGTGPQEARLRAIAGPRVEFLGWQTDERIRELYRESSATLLPGVEDFGIVPVEAQACGCPVVALAQGGACETVVDGTTGILVPDSTPEAFAAGLSRVLETPFDTECIRANALRFSRAQFLTTFTAAVQEALAEKHGHGDAPIGPPKLQEALRPDAAIARPEVQEAPRQDAALGPPKLQEVPRPDAAIARPEVQEAPRQDAAIARPEVQEAPRQDAALGPPKLQEAPRENQQ